MTSLHWLEVVFNTTHCTAQLAPWCGLPLWSKIRAKVQDASQRQYNHTMNSALIVHWSWLKHKGLPASDRASSANASQHQFHFLLAKIIHLKPSAITVTSSRTFILQHITSFSPLRYLCQTCLRQGVYLIYHHQQHISLNMPVIFFLMLR